MEKEGLFVAFEGIDGSGKTTLIEKVYNKLQDLGIKSEHTFQPGATPFGHEIREILLNKYRNLDALTELFLFEADRRYHIGQIEYLLKNEYVVLIDRFILSSIAYQGFGNNFPISIVRELNDLATNGLEPDFTVIVDTPIEIALSRAGLDNITEKDIVYFERVREGFLKCRPIPNSFVVDGAEDAEEVFKETWIQIEDLLREKGFIG